MQTYLDFDSLRNLDLRRTLIKHHMMIILDMTQIWMYK